MPSKSCGLCVPTVDSLSGSESVQTFIDTSGRRTGTKYQYVVCSTECLTQVNKLVQLREPVDSKKGMGRTVLATHDYYPSSEHHFSESTSS